MSHQARIEYLKAVILRYKLSTKKEKSLILNEFCAVCGYSRSYASRILNKEISPKLHKRGCKAKYGPEVIKHLIALWELTGRICSKRMKFAIPLWLPFYDQIHNLDKKTKQLLLEISPSTIDRALSKHKRTNLKGLSSTKGSSWIKQNIPLKKLGAKAYKPGFMEVDTVAHCGSSLVGSFVYSLTMTCINSDWTENRAVWTKDSKEVLSAIKELDRSLPFEMYAYSSDNGKELLNKHVKNYFENERPGEKVKPQRGRPYKKNDQCYVEQKNFTHVRNLFGYDRYDDRILVPLMNEIYRAFWNPLMNYFTPTMKLKEKKRVGSKIVKIYEKELKTPAQRLLENEYITNRDKQRIKAKLANTNPITLKKMMEERLKKIQKIIDINNINRRSSGQAS